MSKGLTLNMNVKPLLTRGLRINYLPLFQRDVVELIGQVIDRVLNRGA